jgi:ribonuclease P protein component
MGVPTLKRIRKRNDFQEIRSQGEKVFCKSFVCQYRFPQEQDFACRLGVIASRRVGNAVKRNRGKRIMRELFRMHEAKLPSNCDVVVILRSSYARYTFAELESHFLNTCAIILKSSKIS